MNTVYFSKQSVASVGIMWYIQQTPVQYKWCLISAFRTISTSILNNNYCIAVSPATPRRSPWGPTVALCTRPASPATPSTCCQPQRTPPVTTQTLQKVWRLVLFWLWLCFQCTWNLIDRGRLRKLRKWSGVYFSFKNSLNLIFFTENIIFFTKNVSSKKILWHDIVILYESYCC